MNSANIVITSASQARNMVARKPHFYRVISIGSYGVPRENVKESLYLNFNDVTLNSVSSYGLATTEDCKKALKFLQQDSDYIVHCQLGVSRSTAVVLGYFLQSFPYPEAIDRLFDLRPQASPNRHVLKLMCQILDLDHQYSDIVDYIENKDRPLHKSCKKCYEYTCKDRNSCLHCGSEEFSFVE